ncbi:MAG: hypothetical protein H6663_13215 [Candidatus Promineofilum sp.]|nr:hypothetical protein [Promineifilum sp.]
MRRPCLSPAAETLDGWDDPTLHTEATEAPAELRRAGGETRLTRGRLALTWTPTLIDFFRLHLLPHDDPDDGHARNQAFSCWLHAGR